MEHLHPGDAGDQLRNLWRALKPEGKYVCVTPNRLTGPHDISQYFDDAPSGLPLMEHGISELRDLMLAAGFRSVSAIHNLRGRDTVLVIGGRRHVRAVTSGGSIKGPQELVVAPGLPLRGRYKIGDPIHKES